MSINKFEKDMNIIKALPDEPNDVGGLSADQLKSKFDEGGNALKDFINNEIVPALEDLTVIAEGAAHTILDKNGNEMAQRPKMQFNGTVTDNGTATVITYTASDVGAREADWLPTIAEIGAAPSGYGLGELNATVPENNDANQAISNGFYTVYSNTAHGPAFDGVMMVESRAYNQTYQTVKRYGTGSVVQRCQNNGDWSYWEWVNPPMLPDEEYRTTERWNGKPVYRKHISYYASENLGTTQIWIPHGITNLDQVVRVFGAAGYRPFPVLFEKSEQATVYGITTESIYIRCTNSLMGAEYWHFDLAYTKA